jgi:hypothetical protein
MDVWISTLTEDMIRYLGQTVTIFTKSGGISGAGFTGVLVGVDCNVVRLLCDVGAPPACPVGSACTGHFEQGFGYGGACGRNPLGAICVIPTCAIAAFTHNAI